MKRIRTVGEFAAAVRLVNEATSPEELMEHLKSAGAEKSADELLERKQALGGVFQNDENLIKVIGRESASRLAKYAGKLFGVAGVEKERLHFTSLLLANPNYFGTIPGSELPAVSAIKGNTSYEEMTCAGLNTPLDRLEAVIHIKKSNGYSGGICTNGSREYVRFFVDLHDNGVWHDVGVGSVRVYDIGGNKPLCYAVYRDFEPIRKLCTVENIVKVRAILSWNVQPPAGNPNWAPVWGNVLNVEVQIRPRLSIVIDDIFTHIPWDKFEIKDPIGPIIKQLDPKIPIPLPDPPPFTFAEKRALYREAKVPGHRLAFTEIQQLMATSAATITSLQASPLAQYGFTVKEISEMFDALQKTDGDTSFEELRCVGLKPEKDLVEAVFTVKKQAGYSGSLCREGSTEYVAFWGNFFNGAGYVYLGTSSLQVHDLNQVGPGGVHYAVDLKADLKKYLVSCQAGARLARLRAILSWEVPPPPNDPNWVPVWGNREECLVQIRPGEGDLAAILEVNDVAINEINPVTGRATGTFVEASGSFQDAPFGGTVTIAGTIGLGTDFMGGGAAQYKYRVEKKPYGAPDSAYEPITGTFTLRKVQRVNGLLVDCAPGQTVCAFSQAPLPAATEGGESGWYLYHEDLIGAVTQEILSDVLAVWSTSVADEGKWQVRLHVKDAAMVHSYSDPVTVRLDNTRPVAAIDLQTVEVGGVVNPAPECGKFPVGAILRGTFSVTDAGTVDSSSVDFKHFRVAGFSVAPAGPAGGAAVAPTPAVLSYPTIGTAGTAGTWELNTAGMQPCGYVVTLEVYDRAITDAGNAVGYRDAADFGFCLEPAQ